MPKLRETYYQTPISKGEYIFLLDRSGSMNGVPLKKSVEALELFLRSIPDGSFFNITSFGTSHSSMFTKSVPYN